MDKTEESTVSSEGKVEIVDEAPVMSKNAMKREAKRKRMIETRAEWRKQQNEKKKLRKKALKLSKPAPKEKDPNVPKLSIAEKRQMEKDKKEKFIEDCKTGQRIVVDCSFEELMTDRETRSIAQQLHFCYGVLKRSQNPCHLHISGFGGVVSEQLNKIAGFDSWSMFKDEKSFEETFPKDDLVYLTADSPNMIHELDSKKCYIVGGIADRNRHKMLTFNKAQEMGIATAQLPIGEFVKMSRCKVLTVNHVFQILQEFQDHKDWKKAFEKTIPGRKMKKQVNNEPKKKSKQEENSEETTTAAPVTTADEEPPMKAAKLEAE
eukprot:TRINITY_DN780010_c0_g1_i1.p1 TRINITY_DN780010_c0_g1~~TRINITY_DN780010_c0_g1_i1.p1  ORF type:complete len:320 (-),score=115.90 TRINITY_DN780010_c0_g1_i1:189-1148(-)